MIVRTNTFDKKTGKEIYMNVFTGERGFLGRVPVAPSQRHSNRHPVSLVEKIRSNRKTTRGRRMYFQHIPEAIKLGKGGPVVVHKARTIKHLQYTGEAIARKVAVMSLLDRIRSRANASRAA